MFLFGCSKAEVTKEEIKVTSQPQNNNSTTTSSQTKEEENVTTTPNEEVVPEDINLNLGETAKACDTSVTVNAKKVKNYVYFDETFRKERLLQSDPDEVLILVNVTVKNLGNDWISPYRDLFSITDAEGNVYEYSYKASGDKNRFVSKTLYKGQKNSGIIIFSVPKEARGLKVLFNFGSSYVCGLLTRTTIASWSIPDDIPVEEMKKEISVEIIEIDKNVYAYFREVTLNGIKVKLANKGETPLESLSYRVIVLYNDEILLNKTGNLWQELKKTETKTAYISIFEDLPLKKGLYNVKLIILFEDEEIGTATKTFTIYDR
jgi:hypothetical protein